MLDLGAMAWSRVVMEGAAPAPRAGHAAAVLAFTYLYAAVSMHRFATVSVGHSCARAQAVKTTVAKRQRMLHKRSLPT